MGWTAHDVPPQDGRTFVVTGANSGLGFETSKVLAGAGAHVVMACRNVDKGLAASEQIDGHTTVVELDLSNLDSVRGFSGRVNGRIDVLVNNAGVMAIPRRETADGFEMQLGTNHLGHFALTSRLIGRLIENEGSRVVSVSSIAHRGGRMNFDDLMFEKDYVPWAVYSQSKLANLLFAYELQRRLDKKSVPTISVAAHPGYAATNLQRRGPEMQKSALVGLFMGVGMKVLNAVAAQSAAAGALPILYAATSADVHASDFIGPAGFREYRGAPVKVDSAGRAKSLPNAERLWNMSCELTGESFAHIS